MSRHMLGFAVAVVGLFLAAASALADVVGFGRYHGFGKDQGIGIGVGLLAFVVGVLVARSARRP